MKTADICLLENNHTKFADATAQDVDAFSLKSCIGLNLEL